MIQIKIRASNSFIWFDEKRALMKHWTLTLKLRLLGHFINSFLRCTAWKASVFNVLFWSVFSLTRTDRISPYSVRMRENSKQKNSEYGHFSGSDSANLKILQSDLPRTSPHPFLIKLNLKFLHYILDFLILLLKIQANSSIHPKYIADLRTLQSNWLRVFWLIIGTRILPELWFALKYSK